MSKQEVKKYVVFALMGVICLGCIWFIFAPSAAERAKQEQLVGFNSDIPMPKEESIIGDKASAYEQEQLKQKQAERMRSLDDFNSLLGENSKKQSGDLALLPDESSSTKTGSSTSSPKPVAVQSSVKAYNDVNRTLGNFYERPKTDPEKERLKQELEDIKTRMEQTGNRKNTVEEKMELMEKSFQMVAKYLPVGGGGETVGTNGTNGTEGAMVATTTATTTTVVETGGGSALGKAAVVPVMQVVEQAVSALPQEMSDRDVIQALAQPRNMGFLTATTEVSTKRKNTISACVHADQTVMDGESVRLRLLEPMRAGKMIIRENTILSGFSKIQGERLQITINSLEFEGSIITVEMAIYDTDGQCGIFIPNTKELNAAKEIVANMGTSAGTSINLSNDAETQFVADMGRNVIQGVSQFTAKKIREVKVNLKAGYKVFLLPAPSNSSKLGE